LASYTHERDHAARTLVNALLPTSEHPTRVMATPVSTGPRLTYRLADL